MEVVCKTVAVTAVLAVWGGVVAINILWAVPHHPQNATLGKTTENNKSTRGNYLFRIVDGLLQGWFIPSICVCIKA
jgi:hypothetical protein